MRSLFKNSCYNIVYVVLNILFPLVTSMYVSRILLADGIGKVAYAQTITSYFLVVCSGGLSAYGIRAIARAGNEKDAVNRIFSELLCIGLVISVITFFVYIAAIFYIPAFQEHRQLLLACSLQVVLGAFNIDWFYKGKEEYAYIVTRSLCVKIFSILCVVLLVKDRQDCVLYALITSFALAGNHIINMVHVRKYVSFRIRGLQIRKHLAPWVTLTLLGMLGTLYNTLDITMLEAMLGDEAVGFYSNAHKSINVILSGTTAITAVFLPRLSALYKENTLEFEKSLRMGTDVLSAICIPAAVGVFMLAPQIVLMLYGPAFRQSAGALRLFAPLLIINSFGDLFAYQLLIAIGEEKRRLKVNGFGVLLNVALNSLLIPKFAQNGATVASVISELCINGYLTMFAIRRIRFRFPVGLGIKSCLASGVMGIWLYYLMQFDLQAWLTCLVGVITGVLVYVLFSLLLRNEVLLQMLSKVTARMRSR